MTAPLTEAEAGAALFGWLAEAKMVRRTVRVCIDNEYGGYRAVLTDNWNRGGNGFVGATRAEALMAAARWVIQAPVDREKEGGE